MLQERFFEYLFSFSFVGKLRQGFENASKSSFKLARAFR